VNGETRETASLFYVDWLLELFGTKTLGTAAERNDKNESSDAPFIFARHLIAVSFESLQLARLINHFERR